MIITAMLLEVVFKIGMVFAMVNWLHPSEVTVQTTMVYFLLYRFGIVTMLTVFGVCGLGFWFACKVFDGDGSAT